VVEAVLFSTDAPLSSGKIAQILGIGTAGDVKRHIESLNRRYTESGSAFRIDEIAGGFQMFTLPDYNPWIAKMHRARAESRLSQAALETLAIVAYKQPIMRADIEAIRGVAVGDMLVRLRDMKLIKIVGRAEELGRPLLYGTTKRFLEVFGLSSLADLPKLEEEQSPAAVKLKVVPP
jgi:segregation and condensation protein B